MVSSLLQAANNLIVLGREEAGAERIFQNNGVALLLQLVDTKRPELVLAAVRTLSGMCSGHRARVRRGGVHGGDGCQSEDLEWACGQGVAGMTAPDTMSKVFPFNLGCLVPDPTEADPLVFL